jgi:hypothetical protein
MDNERVFELNKLILEQINDLWLVGTALIVFQVLVISYASGVRRVTRDDRQAFVTWTLALSALCYAASLGFGYMAKGALIDAMIPFATNGAWEFPKIAEVMSFGQIAALGLGLALFVITFVASPRFLSRAVTQSTTK